MAKKIMAALMIVALICVMIVPANAAATFDSQSYFIAFRSNTTSGTWKSSTGGNFPYTLTSANSTINGFVFLGYKTNQVISDGSIIVATVKIDNIEGITLLGAGQPTSATLFDQTGITYAEMMSIPLSQEIIASTSIQLGDAIQHTVTYKAKGYTSQNAVIGYKLGAIATSGSAITLVNCDLYESIQEAASSGTTPEEMRDVLTSWSEEELMPGIQNSVQAGVTSGMEAALEDEKNQASSGAQGGLDELAGALSGVTDDIEQVQSTFQSLGAALSYTGQSAVLSVPAIVVPGMGQISDARTFNLTQEIDNIVPAALLTAIRAVLSLSLISYPIIELIKQLRKLLSN